MSEFTERPPGFVYRDAQARTDARPRGRKKFLSCDLVPLTRLAARYGTPLYVYSGTAIRERVRMFEHAFEGIRHLLCYSVKASSNLSILRMLAKLGCGFDVVSGGELQRVLRANRQSARNVVFSGVGKTAEDMELALKSGILLFNVESASELETLASCAAKLKRTARIALRVNPDVPAKTHPYISTGLHKHKFGVPIEEARLLYERVRTISSSRAASGNWRKYLQVAGVSVHIGSQIRDSGPFAAAMERVADLVLELRSRGHTIQYVDAGGGLGIHYRGEDPAEFREEVSQYAQAVRRPLRKLDVTLLLEPGRSIVGPAAVLLTRVLYRKTNGDKRFVVVDAAMNDLIRPSLYQAEHEIVPVLVAGSKAEVVDVVGPVCESGDFFARGRRVPETQEGDLLAILDAGAYGMSLASNYNTRPRAAEVLVDGNAMKLIRRRETVADLMQAEI